MRNAQQLAPGPRERVRRRVGRMPLGDDVVVGHILQRESGGDEVERRVIARRAFAVHGVEQAVARELGVKGESDEPALEPVVDRERERRGHVRVHRRLVVTVEQVQEAARVVDEPAAVGKVANVADARPAGGTTSCSGGRSPRVSGRRTRSRISTIRPRFSTGAEIGFAVICA